MNVIYLAQCVQMFVKLIGKLLPKAHDPIQTMTRPFKLVTFDI